MKRPQAAIVGVDVPDQRVLRAPECVRTLDDFLAFLAELEAVFGPIQREPQLTTGNRFLL